MPAGDPPLRHQRVAENERRIRDANRIVASTIEGWSEPFEGGVGVFFCACGHARCTATIEMEVEAYRRVHDAPHRYLVAPGHVTPEIERVVERHEVYEVVEKRPQFRAD